MLKYLYWEPSQRKAPTCSLFSVACFLCVPSLSSCALLRARTYPAGDVCCCDMQTSSPRSVAGAVWPRREHGKRLPDDLHASSGDVAAVYDDVLRQEHGDHFRLASSRVPRRLHGISSLVSSFHRLSQFHIGDMRTISSHSLRAIPQFRCVMKRHGISFQSHKVSRLPNRSQRCLWSCNLRWDLTILCVSVMPPIAA